MATACFEQSCPSITLIYVPEKYCMHVKYGIKSVIVAVVVSVDVSVIVGRQYE
jgi:hypothetical protein